MFCVGFSENAGDAVIYLILTEDHKQVLVRSVVRSANEPMTRNGKMRFSDEVKKMIKTDFEHKDFKHPKPLKPAEECIFVDIEDIPDITEFKKENVL